jgi:hypothetical protein
MDEKREDEIAGILARGVMQAQRPRLDDSREHGPTIAKQKQPAAVAGALHERCRNRRQEGDL